VSQNWAGYVAGGTQFSSVSGSWVQPSAKCGSGQTYSAFWVGIGGASNESSALEQTGTQADCTADGGTEYYAWYELVPAAPVKLDLAIKPGDHISAKVNVSGSNVTVVMSNQTTGQSTSKTLQMDNPDTSSAEWIAEAPAACDGGGASGSCQVLPLADFGTVQFTSATATANGHTGTISDPNWSAQSVQLGGGGVSDVSYSSGAGASAAAPSSLSSDGSAFSVATDGSSGSTGAAGGAGDYGYGDGGYSDGGYPGAGDGYDYGGYPGAGDGYGQYGYGGGSDGYGYGYGDGYGLF
jgi:hypothetical protein